MEKTEGRERFDHLFMPTYAPFGKVFVRGEGRYLFDEDGKGYLDFCAGIATAGVGHCHPEVVKAIQRQAEKLMHISNLYLHRGEMDLAARLMKEAFEGRLFLCQSGAEANETAIKLTRKYFSTAGKPERYSIISTLGSFHGRTLATIAATGQDKYRAGFEPMPEGFVHVPYDDLQAVEEAIDGSTAAVMVEPIQGEGGVVIPQDGYISRLRDICNRHGLLLILDEVQTGFGRTGFMFAHQVDGIQPDIMTIAKAFGGGLPLGGALAGIEVAEAFSPGDHATTFGGNPVTCAAALASLRVIHREGLVRNAVEMGARLLERLSELASAFPGLVAGLRGRGLLVGMELSGGGQDAVSICQEEGLLLTCVQGNVLRFTPPLSVTAEEIDEAAGILNLVFKRLS